MIERYKRQTVLWLFQNLQVSFAEIAEVMSTTRDEVNRLYQDAKAEQDRIFNSPAPFCLHGKYPSLCPECSPLA